jgi:hypothetical protein
MNLRAAEQNAAPVKIRSGEYHDLWVKLTMFISPDRD